MNFKPTFNRVVLEEVKEEKTSGGIWVPQVGQGEKVAKANVVAVGPGAHQAGILIPVNLTVGQKVLFAKRETLPMKIDGSDYVLASDTDILGFWE